jgi:hypothetical protein
VAQALALSPAAIAGEQADSWAVNAPRAEGYAIELVSAEPPPGTPLLRGASVPFEITASYSLEAAAHGTVILVFQDESNTVVTGERKQTTVEVEKGNGTVTLADITAAQWEDYHRLVADTFATSRREFPDEHLEVFHSPDSALHLAFTTAGHRAHPAWITRQVQGGSVDQIGYFAGPEEPFAELFRSYLALTKTMLEGISEETEGP